MREFFIAIDDEFLAEVIVLSSDGSLAFTRTLVDRLKRNCIVALAGTGSMGQRLIPLPLLGSKHRFSTGMASLARSTGAALLPIIALHPSYTEIEVVIGPAIEVESAPTRDGNLVAAMRQYAELLENYCKQYPEQLNDWKRVSSETEAPTNVSLNFRSVK